MYYADGQGLLHLALQHGSSFLNSLDQLDPPAAGIDIAANTSRAAYSMADPAAPPHKMGKPSPLVEEIKPAFITRLKVGNDTLESVDGDDNISSGQVCWQAGRLGGGKAEEQGQAVD